jgi:hypothetical protein
MSFLDEVTPCRLVCIHQRFRGTYCLNRQLMKNLTVYSGGSPNSQFPVRPVVYLNRGVRKLGSSGWHKITVSPRFTTIHFTKFLPYRLLQWSACPNLGASPERQPARPKSFEQNRPHANVNAKTKRRPVSQFSQWRYRVQFALLSALVCILWKTSVFSK